MRISVDLPIELILELEGKFLPGRPGDLIDPPEDDIIEDEEITGLALEVATGKRLENGRMTYRRVNVLDGVDRRDPNVQRLLENILKCVEREAQEALLEGAAE